MAELILYIDDSGSRHPDKKSDKSREGRDWFALGGYVIEREREPKAKELHAEIVKKWNVRAPFHITDMLARKKAFSWLGKISEKRHDEFWDDYKEFLSSVPVVGTGCVVDRPGYLARGYLEKHGANRWLICRSAFDILVERAAKYALLNERKLSVVFEGDAGINETMKSYFLNLKQKGLEFDEANSEKYRPLPQEAFAETLSTIEWKGKSSIMLQIADSYVYSIARNAYDKRFGVYRHIRDARRIINFTLKNEHIPEMGVKHYCFDRR